MTRPEVWRANVYQAGGQDNVDPRTGKTLTFDAEPSRPMALAALRDQIRSAGYLIADDTLTPGDHTPIRVQEDESWDYWSVEFGPDAISGYIVEWSAQGRERVQDEPAIDPAQVLDSDTEDTSPLVVFEVPAAIAAEGGGLRVRHSLDAPQGVTVTAYQSTGEPMGYMFATPIDEHVEHVELLPGTHRLHVVADPVEEEPDSSDPEKVADPVPVDG